MEAAEGKEADFIVFRAVQGEYFRRAWTRATDGT